MSVLQSASSADGAPSASGPGSFEPGKDASLGRRSRKRVDGFWNSKSKLPYSRWATWCVATTFSSPKFRVLASYLLAMAGRYTVVPSVVGRSPATHPMPFRTSSCVGAISTCVPARARQYMRTTSFTRESSTTADRELMISWERADSSRK